MATFDFSTLEAIPEKAGNLLLSVYPKYTEIEANSALSREGKNVEQDKLIGNLIAELDRLEAVAQSEAERIEKQARKILAGQPADTQTQILEELKAQRVWERIRRKLDAHADPSSLLRGIEAEIDQAGREGDRFTLKVLREELPAYLAAHRMTSPQVTAWIDQAEVPLLTPGEREARKALMTLEENYPRVLAALSEVRHAAAKKAFKVAALPGWNGKALRLNW